jgi:UV DNA damage endonuclease
MPIRNLGYACQNLTLNENVKQKNRTLTDRTCRLDGFNLSRISELIRDNSKDLVKIMQWNADNDVRFFRVSSNVFPFFDHFALAYTLQSLKHHTEIVYNFKEAGKIASENNIRLSCHPGPYTCIASPNEVISDRSLVAIKMHHLIGQLLSSENFCINFHVGGVYESKDETAKRFCKNFSSLPKEIQEQATIENDDKSSMWSITDLYEKIYQNCGVKLVLDIHHHKFRNDEPLTEAAKIAFSTWSNEIPKVHYSESAEQKRPQAHSDFVESCIPELSETVQYDVMIEAKQKDKALLRYRSKYVYQY